jgi:hypothetical protein
VHRYVLTITREEEHEKITQRLTSERLGSLVAYRVDDRGIPIPSWWDEDDTTASESMQTMFTMKSWRGGN